jgi:serine/threonine protein kinase
MTDCVGCQFYHAPEIILTAGNYGASADIWSVGCILYELLTNKLLFDGRNELDIIHKIHSILGTPSSQLLSIFKQKPNQFIEFKFPYQSKKSFSDLLPQFDELIIDFLERLLTHNPYDGISVSEALSHPVFGQLNKLENFYNHAPLTIPFSEFVIRSEFHSKYVPNFPLKSKMKPILLKPNIKPFSLLPDPKNKPKSFLQKPRPRFQNINKSDSNLTFNRRSILHNENRRNLNQKSISFSPLYITHLSILARSIDQIQKYDSLFKLKPNHPEKQEENDAE